MTRAAEELGLELRSLGMQQGKYRVDDADAGEDRSDRRDDVSVVSPPAASD